MYCTQQSTGFLLSTTSFITLSLYQHLTQTFPQTQLLNATWYHANAFPDYTSLCVYSNLNASRSVCWLIIVFCPWAAIFNRWGGATWRWYWSCAWQGMIWVNEISDCKVDWIREACPLERIGHWRYGRKWSSKSWEETSDRRWAHNEEVKVE